MPLDPLDIDVLRMACAHIYDAWEASNLQPGRGETEWPGPEQRIMVEKVLEEWMDLTQLPLGEFPWDHGRIVREWIGYRKMDKDKKAALKQQEQLTLFSDNQGIVYFWQEQDTGHIKIGWTGGSFEKRERSMKGSNSSELKLLGSMSGSKQHERSLHITFAGYRIHPDREWFRPHRTLLDFITKHCTQVGCPN
jgi:hypothetical protein